MRSFPTSMLSRSKNEFRVSFECRLSALRLRPLNWCALGVMLSKVAAAPIEVQLVEHTGALCARRVLRAF